MTLKDNLRRELSENSKEVYFAAGKPSDTEVSIRGTLKSSGGKVVPSAFVAYNWANILWSFLCKDVIARAKKRRYRLK